MALHDESTVIKLHGRSYRIPVQPTVIVCVDGFDVEYLTAGCRDGILPTMSSWIDKGFHATANCAIPALTNPNNLCIITGAPTSTHGIAGNYFLDKTTGEEHMVTDDSRLRGSTILAEMAKAGVRVAAITAKDKLRKIINHGLSMQQGALCFSAQYAHDCTLEEHGIEDVETWLGRAAPQQYSGDLSLFVLAAGLKLLQQGRSDLLYLTLSDYIQHKYAPGSPEANHFMREVDRFLGEMQSTGAVVAVTGDHGMSDKSLPDGSPNVLFLEDELHTRWPDVGIRVICPIVDPFVKHHGALGGFARIHLSHFTNADFDGILAHCRSMPQVELVMTGAEAASYFEMPTDREGDIVVIAKKNAAVGGRKEEHDLTPFDNQRLRSHGGITEQAVPLLRSTALKDHKESTEQAWRNFDVFDIALNF